MVDTRDVLVGWGYEGRSIADLLDQARDSGVHAVVDVRLHPVSRRPGFSKRKLAEFLEGEGLSYVHLPTLGNPKENRAGFAQTESVDQYGARARYANEVLGTVEAGNALRQLVALTSAGPVIVLCFEAVQSRCHRDLVIRAAKRALAYA